jgi:site-specific recombinase XerD
VNDDLRSYFRGFSISLRARNKSPRTVESYLLAAEQLAAFLDTHDHPTALCDIRRRHVEEFMAVTLETRAPATAAHRYASLQQFFRWAVGEGEIDTSPMDGMSKPRIPDKPVPVLTDEQLRALLDTVKGTTFEDRRDAAILRLFIDTGARLSEIAELTLHDVDLDRQQLVTVVKGRHTQVKFFGARTAQALDRYERARRRHRLADLDWFWLSLKGRLSASGIRQMVKRRALEAGIGHVHPHQFRHTFAHRWLSEGGNEGDLQRLMGWKDRQMLDRYGSSTAQGRAKEAHQRMRLGDRL